MWLAVARDGVEPREPAPDTAGQSTESEREVLEALIAEVAAESRAGPRVVKIEAAPRRVPMARPGTPQVDAAAPSPPEGYTFVEHHGELSTERFQPRKDAGDGLPEDGLGWLGSPGWVSRLVDQAASADRDWSFGWIRLGPDSRPSDIAPSWRPWMSSSRVRRAR